MVNLQKAKHIAGKVWYFIWEDDSIWSWIVNVFLAFVIIKFIVYPGLGFILATSHPIVAVVSGSMEHRSAPICAKLDENGILCLEYYKDVYTICGLELSEKKGYGLDDYFSSCGNWYTQNGISKDDFSHFQLRNGFNRGDIIVLQGKKISELRVGDIIVFMADRPDPIIHRIVKIENDAGSLRIQTKGDHNSDSWGFEQGITEDRIIGRAFIRIPFLGYIKIWFVELLGLIGIG